METSVQTEGLWYELINFKHIKLEELIFCDKREELDDLTDGLLQRLKRNLLSQLRLLMGETQTMWFSGNSTQESASKLIFYLFMSDFVS